MMKYLAIIGQMVLVILLIGSCSPTDEPSPVDCSVSTLALTLSSKTDASSCTAADGILSVSTGGGEGPFSFSIGSISNDSGEFQGLTAGNYRVKVVDANACERVLEVTLQAQGSTLDMTASATSDTDCLGDNGTITAAVTGGVGPFEFRINDEPFGSTSNFTNLKSGEYSVEVKDSEGCSFVNIVTIAKGDTGVSFASQIQPIISTKCAITGCHNGDNGANRNWTIFDNVKNNASNIKLRTANRSMPLVGSLTQDQIDLIGCWVDDGAKNN